MIAYKRLNDAQGTRAQLLLAARALFARDGYDGTSVRAITQQAAANLGAVTYHFGSKRALYEAVLGEALEQFVGRVEAAAYGPGGPPERIGAIVHRIFEFFRQYPEAPQLLARELLLGDGPPTPLLAVARRNLDAIGCVVRDGQRRGEFAATEPVLAVFTLLSQCIWFALARRQLAVITGVPLDRPEHADLMEHHIREVVLRALAAEGR